jgi:hypothetical protein
MGVGRRCRAGGGKGEPELDGRRAGEGLALEFMAVRD